MSFIWPPLLLTVALVPLGAWLSVALMRRRRRLATARGGVGFMGAPTRQRTGRRGTIPTILMLAGFILLTIALARPQAALALPHEEGTVILAFDVSASMGADDVDPTRMEAAKAASEAFVQAQPASVAIGVVAFSDSGISVQTPTNDQGTVLAAISRLQPQRGTSIAQGITASLTAISVAEAGPNVDYYSNRSPQPTVAPRAVEPGSHTSALIVLLSDGENNEQPNPLTVAQGAADQGIRIYTVGIGTAQGTTLDLNGFRVHTSLDELTLQRIAQVTDGTYFNATNQGDLHSVYGQLSEQLVIKPELIEVTALFAGAGVLLLMAGGLSSLFWLGRLA